MNGLPTATDPQIGFYLGTPVLVVGDYGDGWILCAWPDNETPRNNKPFTFEGGLCWRMWNDQVKKPGSQPTSCEAPSHVELEALAFASSKRPILSQIW